MDTGGLAQMTYTSPFNNNGNSGLGVPHAGFASRGKAPNLKRLSVPPKVSTIDETRTSDTIPTPRTARGHLLAGLRTAPKSATHAPASFRHGLENSRYATAGQNTQVPQTATGAFFPQQGQQAQGMSLNSGRQIYSLPEHVLAPPTIDFPDPTVEDIDPKLYEELRATNAYLAQQQRALQQQLLLQTAALNLGSGYGQQYPSLYTQQLQQGLQPIVQAVPNNPGILMVYNPMTGQQSFILDPSYQQQQQQEEQLPAYSSIPKPPTPPTPTFRLTPPQASASPVETGRTPTPPKTFSPAVQEVEPLPPPSANAFRRGHKKSMSIVSANKSVSELKSAGPKSAGFPQTPMNGSFGPGQARAGEHPVRQPRGPPSIDELVSKPTTKHEGSKNFAARQRRRAVHNLVRAGLERRTERNTGSGSATPASEAEFNFSVASDENDYLQSSTTVSSRPSLSSLRGPGVIGSERKEKSRERSSVGSASSDEVPRRFTPSFEMRKTPVF